MFLIIVLLTAYWVVSLQIANSWTTNFVTYYMYQITISNLGSKFITDVTLCCSEFNPTDKWGIIVSPDTPNLCLLTNANFPPGTNTQFGYSQATTPAKFTLNFPGGPPSPSPPPNPPPPPIHPPPPSPPPQPSPPPFSPPPPSPPIPPPPPPAPGPSYDNYAEALRLGFLYFEMQRAGRMPAFNRIPWRQDSALRDGADVGTDLTGGYYDAGDNVKFGFPMGYTITMLAYGVVEFGSTYGPQLPYALDAIRWGTDFFMKSWKRSSNRLYVQCGDGNDDHACWQRPEDMSQNRPSYYVDASRPGTEVACEYAAALAAASIVFATSDPTYSATLITVAEELYAFGVTYKGSYSQSVPQVQAFYMSFSGYDDEILWAAGWLYRATRKATYLTYILAQESKLKYVTEMAWDDKNAGAQVLIHGLSLEPGSVLSKSVWGAAVDYYTCSYLTFTNGVQKTPAGLAYIRMWSNTQYVAAAAFVALVHRKHMTTYGLTSLSKCSKGPADLLSFATFQTQYILGKNPMGLSFVVGYGASYPRYIHHRAASIAAPGGIYSADKYTCGGGYFFLSRADPDPNVLAGALVGGPGGAGGPEDSFSDNRQNYWQNEPSTYLMASFTGVLGGLM